MATRSQFLFALVDRFLKAHDNWANPTDQTLYPPLSYWSALDEMVGGFESGDLPADCRPLAKEVFAVGIQKIAHDERDELSPPDSFWQSRQDLETAFQKAGQPGHATYRESVKVLNEQGVAPEQIARIWGLTNPDGSGRPHLVQQELLEPGSVITPDYVHPDDVEASGLAQKSKIEYMAAKSQYYADRASEKQQDNPGPCPETSRELWGLTNMTLGQAAKMLQRPEAEVATEWEQFDAEQESAAQSATKGQELLPPTPQPQPVHRAIPVAEQEPEPEAAEDGVYSEFEDWSALQLRDQVKKLGHQTVRGMSRKELIDKIIELESQPQEIGEEG
jgi:hypothetical protein